MNMLDLETPGPGNSYGNGGKGKEEVRNFKILRLRTEKIMILLKNIWHSGLEYQL